MIEPRIYRAAFVPALLAVVLVMFSLESRPRPLPQGLPGDVVFGGAEAVATTRAIVGAGEDRRAGTAGDREAARVTVEAFRSRGFSIEVDRFQSDGLDLENVIGRRAGSTRRQVLVVAARDASGVPDAGGSAADTAALIELARVFEGRPSERTIVLASVDGSALGEVGTRRLAERLPNPELVDGVLVLSGLGAPSSEAPAVVGWSNGTDRASLGLQRTVADALREEVERVAESPSPAGQLARLAFPVGVGSQGPLIDAGFDAVRIAGGGELADTAGSTVDQVDEDRIGGLGRAAFRVLDALDRGGAPDGEPGAYVTAVSQVMPGWVLSLLAITLIAPGLAATVDAFARARRRRVALLPWAAWLGAAAGAFALGLGLAYALSLAGATPEPPGAPVDPARFPLDAAAWAVLLVVLGAVALAWVGLRAMAARLRPADGQVSAAGAPVVVGLALALALLALWLINPFAALLLTPTLHLWLLATLFDPPPPRRARLVLVAIGLLTPALLVLYELLSLSLDPVSGAWYLLLLVVGGHIGPVQALIWCVLAAVLGATVAIARRRTPRPDPVAPADRPSVRGPAGYAGPGSLGGTESALGPR